MAEGPSSANDQASTTQCHVIPKKGDAALLICNQSFTGTTDEKPPQKLEHQKGSNADLEMVKGAMEDFGYEVVLKENLKADDILPEVKKVREEKIKENSSSFVCFILTYGDKGKIYGSDCKFVYLDEITAEFKKDKCPRLAEKPKLFFIQACRIDNGSDPLMNDSEFRSRSDPAEPHFLIALSLAPEKACLRSEKEGTWAVSHLVEIFKNHYKEQDVCSMLLQVNEKASCEHAKKGYQQPCQLVFTTTKIVKFHPASGMKAISKDTKRNNAEATAQPHYDWCYPVENQYDIAVIINIEQFQTDDMPDREGSSYDVNTLQHLWGNFGFIVKSFPNLTSERILEVLRQEAKEIDEKNNSRCFVCCIMTHGSMGKLFGSDGRSVDISAIIDLFKERSCPALAGKPKMFFIQACREDNFLKRFIPNTVDGLHGAPRENSFSGHASPHELNFFIGYSTVPGEKSYRCEKSGGTFYVSAIAEIFQKYHKDEDVLSMMTRVNEKLVKNEELQQCPAPVLTLTKKMYFSSNA